METSETVVNRKLLGFNITARRWFQRSYGNTYHSVRIVAIFSDGSTESEHSGRHYGYGNQWDQTALELAEERFKITVPRYSSGARECSYLSTYCKANGLFVNTSVSDVARERDL